MKVTFKSALAALPLLTNPAWGFTAEPVPLNTVQMDRITAGTAPVFERIANLLAMTPTSPGSMSFRDLISMNFVSLQVEQLALISQIATGEPITFRQLNTGELAATTQLQSGDQLTLVKSAADAASYRLSPGETVTTRLINPGETVRIQQTGASGSTNYMYIQSAGNSIVTTHQKTGL